MAQLDPASIRRIWQLVPAPLRAALPLRVESQLRKFQARYAAPGSGSAAWLEERLWGGFSDAALPALEQLARKGPPTQAAAAAWSLAGWHGAQGDWAIGLHWLEAMVSVRPKTEKEKAYLSLRALYLNQIGRGSEAREAIENWLKGRRPDNVLALLLAASHRPSAGAPPGPASDAATLLHLNGLFARFGLQPLKVRDPVLPLGIDNLVGVRPGPIERTQQGRVTVIVPAFNAEATLSTALAGITDQTHEDLEILVIDDHSSDGTPDLAADAARADPRIRLIRKQKNEGGYAARNHALTYATGDLITVHDADDWSHPEKISRQLRTLRQGRPNLSALVRAASDLNFVPSSRPSPNLLLGNYSSALLERRMLERVGGWDTARIGADTELLWRIEHLSGRPRAHIIRPQVLPYCPLSFARHERSSLTRTASTHALTQLHGLRREYREAALFWQNTIDTQAVRKQGLKSTPPFFPAPPVLRPDRGAEARRVDVLFIGDFNLQGGSSKSALAMASSAARAGYSPAILHYRRYDLDVAQPLGKDVRSLAGQIGARIIAPGEEIEAQAVIVTYPPVFEELMDRFPNVSYRRLLVIVNQAAERNLSRTDTAYNPARVRAHLKKLLGSEGEWVPISERVRSLMQADPRYPPAWHESWTPLLDPGSPLLELLPDRAKSVPANCAPILGRHGRDHPLKWPRDPDMLLSAYCAGRECQVRFLGGASYAAARLQRWPRNWEALSFDKYPVADFLREIDIFLHFPDPDYIEEFGRAPMEAMAAGVPVILPPEFRETFGAAAIYTSPDDVWSAVEKLTSSPSFYAQRVAAGRAFVEQNCLPELIIGRLERALA